MKRTLSIVTLLRHGLLTAAVAAIVLIPTGAQSQSSPSAAIDLSPSGSVTVGTAISVTMRFSDLTLDSAANLTFRADVVGADRCEDNANGYGLGVDRYMKKVDENPEVRSGTIAAACPPGDYTIEARITTSDDTELASARANFTIVAPTSEPPAEPTAEPTVAPTAEPTVAPTAEPTVAPTSEPTAVPTTEPTAVPAPSVAVALSSGAVAEGTAITATINFGGLASDSDSATTDYVFRADVLHVTPANAAADACEGGGVGVDRYMYKVDEDPEVRSGTIAAACPAGGYTIEARISAPDNTELASARANFTIVAPTSEPPATATATATPTTTPTATPTATATPTTSDRDVLVALYEATDGANWRRNTNWLSDKPINTWHGVTTDDSGHVTKLDLYRNQLRGAIPSGFGNLSNLRILYLDNNQLSGAIPSQLGNLANLRYLVLSYNQLSGAIPTQLGNLANLDQLVLHNNRLSGAIPSQLGNLANLRYLWLSSNQLSGAIPSQLGDLANLWSLALSSNQFSGCVPAAWRNVPYHDLSSLGLPFCQ